MTQTVPESMRLSALICSRYRAFKERHRIELSPITIIIGKNGSGKSIVSRLPLLLAAAISESADGPLDISAGGIEHASTFHDLVNARGRLPFTLGAEISNSTVKFQFETTLRYVAESRALAIEGFNLEIDDKAYFSATIFDEDQLESEAPIFKIYFQDEQLLGPLSFRGLFPSFEERHVEIAKEVNTILHAFRLALPAPSYLGPFRVEPGPSMRYSRAWPKG